jgi:hypothetical protein
MSRARSPSQAPAMKAEKWLILGALAGMAAVQINKQLRLARHRLAEELPDAEGRASIDDVPTVQPATEGMPATAAFATVEALDESVAPSAPL